jgi:hypothetical protein
MTNTEERILRFGGYTFNSAGVLFFAAHFITLLLPLPPSGETEFLNWLAENRIFIAIQNEVFFFATMCPIPAAIVLHKFSQSGPMISSLLGVGLMFVAVPVLAVVNLAEGRLVYPVYDIRLSFDVLKLMLRGNHSVQMAIGS